MSDNLDKEIDEIMGILNREHPSHQAPTPQRKPVRHVPRFSESQSQRQSVSSYSDSERIRISRKRRQQAKIRRWTIIGGAVAVLLLIIILLFKGCAGGDVLKGTWDMDGTTVYQFEGNGKGAMILPTNTYTFKYTINEEEKTVSIDFDDEIATDYTYSYTVDDDSLTLYGSVGKESFEYVFTKQNNK